jgi:hypothetical protein
MNFGAGDRRSTPSVFSGDYFFLKYYPFHSAYEAKYNHQG